MSKTPEAKLASEPCKAKPIAKEAAPTTAMKELVSTPNLFNAAMKECKSRTNFWHKVRCYFIGYMFESMNEIYDAIVYGIQKQALRII